MKSFVLFLTLLLSASFGFAEINPGGVGSPASFPSGITGAEVETKYERKDLPAQLSGTGCNATVFTFSNLVVGKTYIVKSFPSLAVVPGGSMLYTMTIEHDSTVLSTIIFSKSDQTTSNGHAAYDEAVFVATATTATIVGADANGNCRLLTATHASITEKPNLIITTEF